MKLDKAKETAIEALGSMRASRSLLVFVAASLDGTFSSEDEPLDEEAKLHAAISSVVDELNPLHDLLQQRVGADPDHTFMPIDELRRVMSKVTTF